MEDTGTPAPETAPATAEPGNALNPFMAGSLGWIVPGLGHLLLRKYDRAAVFFVSILAMAGLGLQMGGKLYAPPFGDADGFFTAVLHAMSFVGDLGAGMVFFAGWMAGFGREYLARASGDYGTVFFLCAGLLNLLTVLDAYDIAAGKKD